MVSRFRLCSGKTITIAEDTFHSSLHWFSISACLSSLCVGLCLILLNVSEMTHYFDRFNNQKERRKMQCLLILLAKQAKEMKENQEMTLF